MAHCNHHCLADCRQVQIQANILEGQPLGDPSESSVKITRNILVPDTLIREWPQMDRLTLMARMGGLAMFWLVLVVGVCRLVDWVDEGVDAIVLYNLTH